MIRWTAIALSLASPAIVAAAPVNAGGEKFSCDTPGGHYSRYQRPIVSGSETLTASVKVNEMRLGTGWLPVVNVMLSGGATDKRAGFRLLPNRETKKVIVFGVFPGMTANQAIPLGESSLTSPVALSIDVSDDKSELSAGGVVRSGPALVGAQWTVDLSCSSIEANIDDIAIRAR